MEEKLLTVAEAASKLNVSPRTIQRYCSQGRLEHRWVMGARHKELRIVSPIPLSQLPGSRRKTIAGTFEYVSTEAFEQEISELRDELDRSRERIEQLENRLADSGSGDPQSQDDGFRERVTAFMMEFVRVRPAEQKLILKLAQELKEHEAYLVSIGKPPVDKTDDTVE